MLTLNRSLLGAGLAFALSLPAHAQSPAGATEFVIRGVRIFDGTRVLPRGDVWIKDGRIAAVGPRLAAPHAAVVINGAGQTLLPGLIDAHVHTMGEEDFLRSALALGVTTELDMGSAPAFADHIEREQAEGRDLDMADLRSSRTQPTAPDGHGTEYGLPIPTISRPQEAQGLIDTLVAAGADFIGEIVYDDGREYGLRLPTLSKETLHAVIEAAHRRGKLAVVHMLSLQGAKDALAAGADGLVHLFADAPPDSELIALAAQHRAFVIPTLSLLASIAGVSHGPALAVDPRFEPWLSPTALADLRTRVPRAQGNLGYADEAVRRLKAAGIAILAGTDAHNPGTAHGVSLLDELQLLVDAGLTPAEALASATSVNAGSFRLSDRGRIAPGMRADLLLVAGDPTTRIADIANVTAVWKLGVRDDREACRARLDQEKQAALALRHGPPPPGSDSGLVSDFEEQRPEARFGLGWVVNTGRILGGSKPEGAMRLVDGGAGASHQALEITGEIAPGVFGWAGAMFLPGPRPMVPVNLSRFRAITFWTRGDGRTYQAMLMAKSAGSMPLSRPFTASAEWTKITIPLSAFGTDASDLQALVFGEVAVPGPFAFRIDDVHFEE